MQAKWLRSALSALSVAGLLGGAELPKARAADNGWKTTATQIKPDHASQLKAIAAPEVARAIRDLRAFGEREYGIRFLTSLRPHERHAEMRKELADKLGELPGLDLAARAITSVAGKTPAYAIPLPNARIISGPAFHEDNIAALEQAGDSRRLLIVLSVMAHEMGHIVGTTPTLLDGQRPEGDANNLNAVRDMPRFKRSEAVAYIIGHGLVAASLNESAALFGHTVITAGTSSAAYHNQGTSHYVPPEYTPHARRVIKAFAGKGANGSLTPALVEGIVAEAERMPAEARETPKIEPLEDPEFREGFEKGRILSRNTVLTEDEARAIKDELGRRGAAFARGFSMGVMEYDAREIYNDGTTPHISVQQRHGPLEDPER